MWLERYCMPGGWATPERSIPGIGCAFPQGRASCYTDGG
ncbi:MAG: hypothetical protein AVDCRST_MAG18-4079 [uncultured Thermomicrobiales bacterium]|uniref:Uncharacterized protein n=1 Tax=uncultured Thermomicrobiales bacterium TaxID=1645740 RepID=A0A6J4VRZ2_9BACT|nr:MAG: hypothetical protein AVDCRST_MAG18-4079 [uncultured Thermomicrobiales bacterium]